MYKERKQTPIAMIRKATKSRRIDRNASKTTDHNDVMEGSNAPSLSLSFPSTYILENSPSPTATPTIRITSKISYENKSTSMKVSNQINGVVNGTITTSEGEGNVTYTSSLPPLANNTNSSQLEVASLHLSSFHPSQVPTISPLQVRTTIYTIRPTSKLPHEGVELKPTYASRSNDEVFVFLRLAGILMMVFLIWFLRNLLRGGNRREKEKDELEELMKEQEQHQKQDDDTFTEGFDESFDQQQDDDMYIDDFDECFEHVLF